MILKWFSRWALLYLLGLNLKPAYVTIQSQIHLSFYCFKPRAFSPQQDCGEMEILYHLKLFLSICTPSHVCIWDPLNVFLSWEKKKRKSPVVELEPFPGGLCYLFLSILVSYTAAGGHRLSGSCLHGFWLNHSPRPVTEMWNLQGAFLSRYSRYLKSPWLCGAQVSVLGNASRLEPRAGLRVS